MRHMGRLIETNKKRLDEKVAYLLESTHKGFSNAEEAIQILEQRRAKLEMEAQQQLDWLSRELQELREQVAKRLPPLEADSHPSFAMRIKRAWRKQESTPPAPPPASSSAPNEPSG